jgi:hypothetical protein
MDASVSVKAAETAELDDIQASRHGQPALLLRHGEVGVCQVLARLARGSR